MSENKIAKVADVKGLTARNKDYAFSDHASCIYKLAPGVEILSWNILTKCRYKAERTNNSFNINEDTEEYIARLKAIRAQIHDKLEINPDVAVITLQEAPRDKALLRLLVPNGWQVAEHTNTENISSADATIINPLVLAAKPTHLPHIVADGDTEAAFAKQIGRYHVVELIYRDDKFLLVNVHFIPDYKAARSSQHFIVSALSEIKSHKILILGDYNDRLEHFTGYRVLGGQGLYKSGKIQTDLKIVPIDMCVYNYHPDNLQVL